MINTLKKVYLRLFASLALLTAEMLMLLLLFIVAFSVFLFITKAVFLDKANQFDADVFGVLQGFVSNGTTNFMVTMTMLGNYQFLIFANALLTGYYLFRRRKWYSIKVPVVALSSVLVMLLLKEGFNRPRPLGPLIEPAFGFSFPSGHAMGSVTFYGLLVYLLIKKRINPYLRILLCTVLIVLVALIGLSRIYLRVHYASDVLAGFSAGVIWLIISIAIVNRIEAYSKKKLNPVVEQGNPES